MQRKLCDRSNRTNRGNGVTATQWPARTTSPRVKAFPVAVPAVEPGLMLTHPSEATDLHHLVVLERDPFPAAFLTPPGGFTDDHRVIDLRRAHEPLSNIRAGRE